MTPWMAHRVDRDWLRRGWRGTHVSSTCSWMAWTKDGAMRRARRAYERQADRQRKRWDRWE